METLFDEDKRLLAVARLEHLQALMELDISPGMLEEDYLNLLPSVRRLLRQHAWIKKLLILCPNVGTSSETEQIDEQGRPYQYKLWERLSQVYPVNVALVAEEGAFKSNKDSIRLFDDRANARSWLLHKRLFQSSLKRRLW